MANSKDAADNHRLRTRVNSAIPLTISAGETARNGVIEDISMSGIFVLIPTERFEEGPCTIAIELEGFQGCTTLRGTILRITQQGLAIHIEDFDGLESYQCIRNIIMYNSESPAQIEQELGHRTDFLSAEDTI